MPLFRKRLSLQDELHRIEAIAAHAEEILEWMQMRGLHQVARVAFERVIDTLGLRMATKSQHEVLWKKAIEGFIIYTNGRLERSSLSQADFDALMRLLRGAKYQDADRFAEARGFHMTKILQELGVEVAQEMIGWGLNRGKPQPGS